MSRVLKHLFIALILVLLAAPLVVVFGVSLNGARSLQFPPQQLSLHWYGAMFAQKEWLVPLRNSLLIATTASALATLVALPMALHVWTRKGLAARLITTLGVAPFMLPPVITALGFLVFWISLGLYGRIFATIISHAVFLETLPLVTISLGLKAMDRALIEAARTMGATRWGVMHSVILPLIAPYIASGYAFAFVLSLNEYIIAYMVSGFTVETLPIKIFNSLRYGYTPIMAVVSVVFVLTAVLVFGLIGRFGNLPRLLGADRVEGR